jgi:hypothetical protein
MALYVYQIMEVGEGGGFWDEGLFLCTVCVRVELISSVFTTIYKASYTETICPTFLFLDLFDSVTQKKQTIILLHESSKSSEKSRTSAQTNIVV